MNNFGGNKTQPNNNQKWETIIIQVINPVKYKCTNIVFFINSLNELFMDNVNNRIYLQFIFFSESTGYLQAIKAVNLKKAKKKLARVHPDIFDWELQTPKSKQN